MATETKQKETGPRRLWLMRLVAATLVPALFLGTLELGLRLAGFGYSPRFFEEKRVDGEAFLFTNHRFSWRFFPPALSRSAIPQRITVKKPETTYRIILFGESAAIGDPEPAYGFGRQLEVLLEQRYPGTDFEIVNTALTAINSNAILPIARECAGIEADLWLVYMGNNEMVGPYGASTVFGRKAPGTAWIRSVLALKGTRTGQLLEQALQKAGGGSAAPGEWGGIDMFMDNLLRPDNEARQQVYENFRDNLEGILEAGRSAGVPVVLSTVASNLRDCAPFASLHAEGLSVDQLNAWNAHYESGKEHEAAGAHAEALGSYMAAAAIDSQYAELAYRIGRCHGLLGNWEDAMRFMTRARDADALVVRTDSRSNEIIRQAAAAAPADAVLLVDAGEALASASPGGVPGREMFYEHVHFTIPGNYQLALLLAERIVPLLPATIAANALPEWASPATVQRLLAVSVWDKHLVWRNIIDRLSVPPYSSRSTNAANVAFCESMAETLRTRINPRIDQTIYRLALEARPDDYHLQTRFGHYLRENGALDAAIPHFQWVCDTFPDYEGGYQELGIALTLAGRYDEAEASFERVLEINPHYANARKALELIRSTR